MAKGSKGSSGKTSVKGASFGPSTKTGKKGK